MSSGRSERSSYVWLTNFWRLVRAETPTNRNVEIVQRVDDAIAAAVARNVSASLAVQANARATTRALMRDEEADE
jgi:hypothetical protein